MSCRIYFTQNPSNKNKQRGFIIQWSNCAFNKTNNAFKQIGGLGRPSPPKSNGDVKILILLTIIPLNPLANLFVTLDSHSLKISVICFILKRTAANHLDYLALLGVSPKSFTSLLVSNPSTYSLYTWVRV